MALDSIAEGLPTVENFRRLSCDFKFDLCLWRNTGTASWQHVVGAAGEDEHWLEVAGNGSHPQHCTVETAAVFNTTAATMLLFAYQISGSVSATLAVEYKTAADDWQNLLLESGDQGGGWRQAAVTVPLSTVGLRISANATNESEVVRVKSLTATDVQQNWDISCGFEADLCGWSTGAYYWLRTSGDDEYPETGPEQAVEGDWYMFLEAYPAYNKAGGQDGG